MTVATDNSALIAKKIKELPPLPLVVRKLIQITDDDRSNAEDVQQVLSGDQALAGKILKLVNSSFYGMSGEIATISRAVVVLGFAAIRNLATGLGVAGIMAQSGKGAHQGLFWSHAITTASAAQVLATHTGYEDPEEAFIAGLLHDIGHLILATVKPDLFAETMDGKSGDILAREQNLLGATHTKVGQKVMRHWRLPEKLGRAIRFHHNVKVAANGEDTLTPLIALADTLAGVHGHIYDQCLDPGDLETLVKATGMDVVQTGDILRETDDKVEETRLFLKIAADEDPAASPAPEPPARNIVILCTDPLKAEWVRQVLYFFGHTVVPMKDFFATAGQDTSRVDLIILDQGSITPEQLLKMKPVLSLHRNRLAAFGESRETIEIPQLGYNLPVLPLAFSRYELEKLAAD